MNTPRIQNTYMCENPWFGDIRYIEFEKHWVVLGVKFLIGYITEGNAKVYQNWS